MEAAELRWEEDRETDSEVAVGFDYTRGLGVRSGLELGYEGKFGWTDENRLSELRNSVDGAADASSRGFIHRQTVHGGYLTLSRELGRLGAERLRPHQ